MNGYGYRNQKDLYERDLELSRGDLWILGTLLGLFAAVMATGLGQTNSIGEMVWSLVATVIVGSGALAFFWGAIQWGKPSHQVVTVPKEKDSLLARAYEIDRFNNKSSAA